MIGDLLLIVIGVGIGWITSDLAGAIFVRQWVKDKVGF